MNFEDFKLELFYFRKALFQYKSFFKYVYNKYFLSKKLINSNKVLEKEVNNKDLSIHVMACQRDFPMILFSLKSAYNALKNIGQLYIHNNVNLTNNQKRILKKFFPSAILINSDNFLKENNLDNHPLIKKFRASKEYKRFFAKFVDPYFASSTKYRLIIDSDLFWFKHAQEIDQQIDQGCPNSLIMQNNGKSPVYFKDGSKLDDKLASYNSGIVLYKKENLNLDKLNQYLEKIDEDNRENHHFIEQAAYAYCLDDLTPLPEDKYVIKQDLNPDITVIHYTSPRRPLFFIEAVEKIKNNL